MAAFDFRDDKGKLASMSGVGGAAVVGGVFGLNDRIRKGSQAGFDPQQTLAITP